MVDRRLKECLKDSFHIGLVCLFWGAILSALGFIWFENPLLVITYILSVGGIIFLYG